MQIGVEEAVCMAIWAKLHLRRVIGRGKLRVEEYLIACGKQDLRVGEFVEAVELPLGQAGVRHAA